MSVTPRSRSYPDRPIVGVGAVVITTERRVVLVKRRHEPLAGRWSLPGGAVELGETLAAAVLREVAEETGLTVRVGPLVDVLDRVYPDDVGQVQYHFVLADYVCCVEGGVLAAASDALDVAAADPDDLGAFDLAEDTRRIIRRGLELAAGT